MALGGGDVPSGGCRWDMRREGEKGKGSRADPPLIGRVLAGCDICHSKADIGSLGTTLREIQEIRVLA